MGLIDFQRDSLHARGPKPKRRKAMFRGKAELHDPENDAPVATFTEICDEAGTTRATVDLRNPITLSGTERLAIYSTVENEEVIVALARDGEPTEIHRFGGVSSLGCLSSGTGVSLTKSPGGELGTLLVVLGTGTIHGRHH
jgi:hypothetical protein